MPLITKCLFINMLLSPIMILIGNYFKRKILIIFYAILNALFASWLLVHEILGCGTTDITLERKVHLFFINDVSMIFYFVYIPLIIIGSILPLIVFNVSTNKKGRN